MVFQMIFSCKYLLVTLEPAVQCKEAKMYLNVTKFGGLFQSRIYFLFSFIDTTTIKSIVV